MKKIKPNPNSSEIEKARNLMRWASKAYIATELCSNTKPTDAPGGKATTVKDSHPYASLSLVALDHNATPYMMLSDLADHSQNMAQNPKTGMLFDGTAGYRDPLAGGRVTLIGTMQKVDDDRMLQRFLTRHPASKLYAGFKDFSLYRYDIQEAHLIGGFAKAIWVSAKDFRLDCTKSQELIEAETSIIDHMNSDHSDAISVIAEKTLQLEPSKWRMCGIDPEGWDLHNGHIHARCSFDQLVTNASEARNALVSQTKQARAS
ncbi:DUF2470 domain-containing protein [uncultured Kiloniella sp.]|uniref:HugZ family pyridoxamine 5'-phosphate oxidase n=1 Tax=uncultured Kiloniella sp. TaxID=1133091 RepID=UPI00261F0C04|nr:DUF2470 domain-containing protein [uncultured Kiloniella sp.]